MHTYCKNCKNHEMKEMTCKDTYGIKINQITYLLYRHHNRNLTLTFEKQLNENYFWKEDTVVYCSIQPACEKKYFCSEQLVPV